MFQSGDLSANHLIMNDLSVLEHQRAVLKKRHIGPENMPWKKAAESMWHWNSIGIARAFLFHDEDWNRADA
jgi:hypothetical protein